MTEIFKNRMYRAIIAECLGNNRSDEITEDEFKEKLDGCLEKIRLGIMNRVG